MEWFENTNVNRQIYTNVIIMQFGYVILMKDLVQLLIQQLLVKYLLYVGTILGTGNTGRLSKILALIEFIFYTF